MEYDHVKEFCEKFNYIAENYGNSVSKEDEDFIQAWKLELAKALILDFGEDIMFEIGCVIFDLYNPT